MKINTHYHGNGVQLRPGDIIPERLEEYFKKKFPQWIQKSGGDPVAPDPESEPEPEPEIEKKESAFIKKKTGRGFGRKK